MSAAIKKEKEAFLLKCLKKGERTGEFLEKALRKNFPGQVSARFRSEVDGLIKRGEVVREGVGANASFRLGSSKPAAKKGTVKQAVPKASSRTRPAPIPKTEQVEAVIEDADTARSVLVYLARNGQRAIDVVLRKAVGDATLSRIDTVAQLGRLGYIGLGDDEKSIVITRKGYQWLDTAPVD